MKNPLKPLAVLVSLAIGAAACAQEPAAQSPALFVGITDICMSNHNAAEEYFARALERCGHIPVVIPKTADTNALARILSRLDAIVVTGGEDINPALYGEAMHPKARVPNDFRDTFDFMVHRYAAAHRVPVLGICRGEQTMNVCFGGSMYQHIPDCFDGKNGKPAVEHRRYSSYFDAATNPPGHTVAIVSGTKLARLLGTNTLAVVSHHHQAVKRVAPGFRVSAYAPDGVIEAIESIDLPMIGVQFHPETVVAERPEGGFELDRMEQLFRRLGDFDEPTGTP